MACNDKKNCAALTPFEAAVLAVAKATAVLRDGVVPGGSQPDATQCLHTASDMWMSINNPQPAVSCGGSRAEEAYSPSYGEIMAMIGDMDPEERVEMIEELSARYIR